MAIYKSSFNKKPEKKQKPQKVKAPKQQKVKQTSKAVRPRVRVNVPLVCLLIFSVIFIVCCFPSNFFKNFMLGTFGLSVYPITFCGALVSAFFMQKREVVIKKRYIVYLSCAVAIVWFIVHLILTSNLAKSTYGVFLVETYKAKTTAGGLIYSLLSYPLEKLLTTVGAYILSAIALAVFVGLIVDYINADKMHMHEQRRSKFNFNDIEAFEMEDPKILTEEEKTKRLAKRKLGLEKGESIIISSSMPTPSVEIKEPSKPLSKRDYILTPLEPVIPPESESDLFYDKTSSYYSANKTEKVESAVEEVKEPIESETSYEEAKTEEPLLNEEITETATEEVDESFEKAEVPSEEDNIFEDSFDESEYNEIGSAYVDVESLNKEEDKKVGGLEDLTDRFVETASSEEESSTEKDEQEQEEESSSEPVEEIEADVENHEFVDQYAYNPHEDNLGSTVETEVVRPSVDISKFKLPQIKKELKEETEQIKIEDIKEKEPIPPYVAPPVDLLEFMDNSYHISEEELQDNITRLEQVLEDFKVPAKVNNVTVGSAVTRYELTMPRGISVGKITQMSDDIAMTLASNGAIRVEAPIPGKNSVGIEVPNAQVSPVSLREVIDSDAFRSRGNPLSFVLGKDINGDIMFCNLDKMPHLLVAGSTGSGKSVCLNAMLLSMCYKAGPEDLRLILVDPKTVEFATYNGLPHLLIPEVITNKDMAINALDWCVAEMERRYALFAKNHVVNINEYNKLDAVKSKQMEKLPFIVVVVDELADLMLEGKRELEDRILKLAAKARAAGIHLVLATQRPSVDVVTGTIKANLPSRIAFALTNFMDSKTVLDGSGAEKLLGRGDMLFKPQDKPEPRRVQGAFVSNAEIAKVVEFIKENNKPVYDEDAGRKITKPHEDEQQQKEIVAEKSVGFDPVLKDALYQFIQNKQASASMIQRRFSVGFGRAGRIIDQMEDAGFIGPQDGSKPRQVLITMEQYNEIFKDEE